MNLSGGDQAKKRYRLNIVKTCAPTTSYEDEAVDSLYEDIESAMKKVTTQFTIVMGHFNVLGNIWSSDHRMVR